MLNDVLTRPDARIAEPAGSPVYDWLDLPRQPFDLNGPGSRPYVPFDRSRIEAPLFASVALTAARCPESIAIDDGTRQFTYPALLEHACRLAHALTRTTSDPRPVGVLLPNDAHYPIGVLACLAAGRACVLLDSYYPAARNAAIIADAGLSALIVSAEAEPGTGPEIPCISIAEAFDPTNAATPPDGVDWAPADPAFIIYTSGSTGQPKGIALAQRTFAHRSAQLIDALHLNSDDRMMPLGSPCTVAGLLQMFEAFLAGATLIKTDLQRVSLGEVLETIERKGATTLLATPALLRSLCRLDGAAGKITSLRCVHAAGDVLLNVDIEGFRPYVAPGCVFLVTYGATEAPAMCHWFVTADATEGGARVPVGYPLPDYRYALLNDDEQPAAPDEPGELVISSRYTALGEWQNRQLVPGRFSTDAADPEWRILRTGDLVRCRADGLMTVLGRKDRLVKIRGMRVEPYEVECALRRSPEVADAVIVTRHDGENTNLLGFIVPQQNAPDGVIDRLRAELRKTLPPYMQPARLYAVEELPLLPGHKIDTEKLLGMDAARLIPAGVEGAAATGIGAYVATAWESVLDRASFEADLPFDEAGGDSLSLLMLVSELERLCAAKLPLVSFALAMRPSAMVALVAATVEHTAADASASSALVLLKPGSKSPPVFLTHGLGGHVGELSELARHLECDHPIYALQLPGLDNGDETLDRIEEMARVFVQPIIAAEPTGPCLLVGYSLGGLVAFELARQLEAAGRETRLLLLDSHPHPRFWPFDAWLGYLGARIKMQCRQIARGETGDLSAFAEHMVHSVADHWRMRRGRRPTRVPSWLTDSPPLQRIRTGMVAAQARYRPAPYPGRITFVQPERRRIGAPADPVAVWRGRTMGIELARVPGDHLSMVAAEVSATAAQVDGWVTRT